MNYHPIKKKIIEEQKAQRFNFDNCILICTYVYQFQVIQINIQKFTLIKVKATSLRKYHVICKVSKTGKNEQEYTFWSYKQKVPAFSGIKMCRNLDFVVKQV